MAAPNVNGRLHLTAVHQKPPTSFWSKNMANIVYAPVKIYTDKI